MNNLSITTNINTIFEKLCYKDEATCFHLYCINSLTVVNWLIYCYICMYNYNKKQAHQ